jgi:hypothetical protein
MLPWGRLPLLLRLWLNFFGAGWLDRTASSQI